MNNGVSGGKGPQDDPPSMNPKGLQHSTQRSVVRNGGEGEQVGWVAGAQVPLKVGRGGLKCYLDSSGENLRWPWALSQTLQPPPHLHWGAELGWGPYPATRIVLLFKHVLRGGGAGGWPHSGSPFVGKCDSCKASRPTRQQSAGRPRNQSSPLWCQGGLLGHRDCTLGTWPRLHRHPIPAPSGIFRAPPPYTRGGE